MVKIAADGTVGLVIPPASSVSRRQDAPVVFDMTTVGYVVKPEFVMTRSGVFDGIVRQVHVPAERALDIDTRLDFQIAQWLMEQH